MPTCCAVGCLNNTKKGFKLYRLPTGKHNEDRRKQWLHMIGRDNWIRNANGKVCEAHFTEDQFESHRADNRRLLKQTAVPSIFSHRLPQKFRKPSKYVSSTDSKIDAAYSVDFSMGDKNDESANVMGSCVAINCTNRKSKKIPGVTFHSFPKDEKRRNSWIVAVRRKNWLPTSASRICSDHFPEHMIDRTSLACVRLKEGAVPSLFKFSSHPKKTSRVVVKEEKDPSSVEPIVQIKEEPADDYSIPSTSQDTSNAEFILPDDSNSFTSPSSVVEPQFTLSVASLALPYEPESSDGEQPKKKLRTDQTTPNETEVGPQTPVHSLEENSNPGSSKDHFDVFGGYVATKLRSLDQISSAFAQKAIRHIILEAEMGKYIGQTENKVLSCAD